jgi:DNA-directed RNA polymerase subunit RPC12/RpoP
MYCCNNCNHKFSNPERADDTDGDETYESCPRCGSEDFDLDTENLE